MDEAQGGAAIFAEEAGTPRDPKRADQAPGRDIDSVPSNGASVQPFGDAVALRCPDMSAAPRFGR